MYQLAFLSDLNKITINYWNIGLLGLDEIQLKYKKLDPLRMQRRAKSCGSKREHMFQTNCKGVV